MKTNTTTDTLVSIDTASLEDVTGGCAACGQDCGAGAARPGQPGQPDAQDSRPGWSPQTRT